MIPAVAQTVLLDDNFTAGVNPGWTDTGGGVAFAVEVDAGIGSGNALKSTMTTGNRQIYRDFSSITLNTGHSISVTFDYRFTSAPNDVNNSFLVYLMNTAPATDTDVGVNFNPGHVATSNDSVFKRKPADNNEGKFDSFNHGTTAQQLTLELTRSASDEITFDLSWAGNPVGPYSSTSSASVTSEYFSFDRLRIGFLGGEQGEFYLDNVLVTTSAYIWDGGGADNNWTTGGNWISDAAPPTADNTTALIFTGTTRLSPSIDADHTVNSVTFDENAGSFNIGGGSTLTLAGTTPAIYQNDDSDQEISAAIQLGTTTIVDVSGSGNMTLSGAISQSAAAGLTKTGTGGKLVLSSSSNSYTGDTTVTEGTLQVTGKLYDGVAGGDVIVNGGTLMLSNATVFSTATSDPNLILGGGTLQLDSLDSDTNGELQFNNLTLTANSIIDFGSGNAELRFLGTVTDLDAFTLTVYNWSGTTPGGGGTDQLFFDAALTQNELSNIRFYSDSGSLFLGSAAQLSSTSEIVPVPEASTWASLGGLALLVPLHFWRQRRRRQTAEAVTE